MIYYVESGSYRNITWYIITIRPAVCLWRVFEVSRQRV